MQSIFNFNGENDKCISKFCLQKGNQNLFRRPKSEEQDNIKGIIKELIIQKVDQINPGVG